MDDLRQRFASLDGIPAPDLWADVEHRVEALGTTVSTRRVITVQLGRQDQVRGRPWGWGVRLPMAGLIAAGLIGGTIAVGSGLVRLPSLVPPVPTPSAPPSPSDERSSTPVETARPAGWTVTGAMTQDRVWHTATLLADGRVLVVGGGSVSSDIPPLLDSAEVYDPIDGTWVSTGSMSTPRGSGQAATRLADGRVLVVGGSRMRSGQALLNTGVPAELYDPATGAWSATGSMLYIANFGNITDPSTVLLIDGRVLAVGDGHAELYDPGSGVWTITGSMNRPRSEATIALLRDGGVLAAGGIGTSDPSALPTDAAEIYDPATGTWSLTASMIAPRYLEAAIVLSDGRVLVSGGSTDTIPVGFLSSAEIYDPATGTWSATGDVVTPRYWHHFILLANGEVLAVGGLSASPSGPSPTDSAELYDPATGTWTKTELMSEARAGLTATLLDGGTVLVAGGQSSLDGPALSSAELFDPGH